MAEVGKEPIPNTPVLAIETLDRHMPLVLRGKTLEEMGWERPDLLTLLVPLRAVNANGSADEYLLRLHFGYYPEWPPSAQFVNPITREYKYPDDMRWLPRIEGTNEIQVHPNYDNNKGQLICSSVTLEFYLVRHGVEQRHLWGERQNFAATLSAIQHGLRQPFYKGRHSQ